MNKKIAVCDLDCEAYIATPNNDDKLREKGAESVSELNKAETTREAIPGTNKEALARLEEASADEPAEITNEIYVQYRDREASTADIIERVKAHYASRNHTEPVEKIQVYLNIVESTAYYVINDRVYDKICLFV